MAVALLIALIGFVGLGLASNAPPPLPESANAPSPTPGVAFVPRPSPWAVASAAADPARLEGASALAATEFVIPPPRWLAGRRQESPFTARLHGFSNWRTDPYQE